MTRVTIAVSLVLVMCRSAEAQPASPRIGLFVVDLHATFPNFPSDSQTA